MKVKHKLSKLYFSLIGLGALVWFLIRVIPKPSRATYPCMQAAYPLASGFVVYLLGLVSSVFTIYRIKKLWREERNLIVAIFLMFIVVSGFLSFQAGNTYQYPDSFYLDTPNDPIGTAQGIFPGRVVWSWNPDATNEDCKNDQFGDAYYLPKNTDIDVVEDMVTNSILNLTGQSSVSEAWDALFVYFNQKKGKGETGYQSGEKIFIKTNGVGATVASRNNHNITDLSNYTMSRTAPQPVLIILRELINDCGVPQENISVGDPQRDVQNEYWDLWHTEFPDVNYICYKGGEGRTKSVSGDEALIFYSDKGEVLRSGDWSDATAGDPIYEDKFYTVIEEADYMINVAALKVHERAGMTLLAKIHFGSHSRDNAMHLHNGLVNPDGMPTSNPKRDGYGLYRVLVDIMGHEKLGNNTMLFVVDGLWGAPGANLPPVKFETAPFNNDWTSSMFMSLDQIALESVCYDFLKNEFTSDRHNETYPQMIGVDDHLHQAADSKNWPEGIQYDPENDGTILTSLGTHEHWNNADEKLYSRNLGTGEGIELVKLHEMTSADDFSSTELYPDYILKDNYPNPFNPSTTISYTLSEFSHVELLVFDMLGNEIEVLVNKEQDAGNYSVTFDTDNLKGRQDLSSGTYIYRLKAGDFIQAKKMTLIR